MSTQSVIKDLRHQLGDAAVRTETGVLLSYSYDGTFQQRLPDAVIAARTAEDVQKVLRLANDAGMPVITRGAGTSLSGGTLAVSGSVSVAGTLNFTGGTLQSATVASGTVVQSTSVSGPTLQGVTLAAWIKPEAFPAGGVRLIDKTPVGEASA